MLADVPVVADAHGLGRPLIERAEETTVLLPVSELQRHLAPRLGCALGAQQRADVFALHVELGSDDVSQTRATWAARALPIPVKVVHVALRDLGQPAAGRDPRSDHGRSRRRLCAWS